MQKIKLKITAVNGSHVEVSTLLNEEMSEMRAVHLLSLLSRALERFKGGEEER